jgi:hypothetical protein
MLIIILFLVFWIYPDILWKDIDGVSVYENLFNVCDII